MSDPSGLSPPRPVRAYCKIVIVASLLGLILGALITLFSREAVNDFRQRLTLWNLIAVVAIINITSFMLFALFWSIYRWIKRDLEPPDDDQAPI